MCFILLIHSFPAIVMWIKALFEAVMYSEFPLQLNGWEGSDRLEELPAHPRHFHYPKDLMERFNVRRYGLSVVSEDETFWGKTQAAILQN